MSDDLSACVHCGLCLTACPTYRLSGMEGYSPRGRIAAIKTLDDHRAELSPVLSDFVDTCLGCRACEAVCPSGVPYGRILEHARERMPPAGGPVRRAIEAVLLWAVARRWRLSLLSLPLWFGQRLRLVPRSLGVPPLKLRDLVVRMSTNYAPDGDERGQVVLFAGCVQDAWARDIHWGTVTALTKAGYRVRMPHGQACCGALHAHTGRLDAARALARRNLAPLRRYDGPIVVDAGGCGAKLKEYAELAPEAADVASRIRDVSEVLTADDVRRVGAVPPDRLRRIAMHDSCHLNFVQKVHDQPRELLRAAGYEIVEIADGGRCCGAAGTYSMHHRDWAQPLRDSKLELLAATSADAVAVANPGCLFWMSSAPDAPRMLHPIQLVAMAMVNAARIGSMPA